MICTFGTESILKLEKQPDILLIDGGLAHASVSEDVVKALGLNIPVLGMVKDHKHKTKGLVYSNTNNKHSWNSRNIIPICIF